MSSEDLASLIQELVGEAPEGLEWLSYYFSYLLVFAGLGIVTLIILKIFKIFDRS